MVSSSSSSSSKSTNKYTRIIKSLRKSFRSKRTLPIEWRKAQINCVYQMVTDNYEIIVEALKSDLGRPEFESKLAEISYIQKACKESIASLDSYMMEKKVSIPMSNFPSSGKIVPEPLGLVLIIGPWNFPFQLTIVPLIGAIAAGNCAIIKPSEVSSQSSKVLAKLIPQYLDKECFEVVMGGVEETTDLLRNKFDHIFYTGSTMVGKIIYEAAAKHLTPVTLELGGKSPTIVDSSSNILVAARRILWGKILNSGQICIAPDYVLLMKDIADEFYETLKKVYKEFLSEDVKESVDYSRIINERHMSRLLKLLEEDEKLRGDIIVGGEYDEKEKFIAPTIFKNTSPKSKLMEDEIFGPFLPIIEIDSIDEAIEFINDRPKPLALYCFTENNKVIDQVINETSSGAVSINETIMHVGISTLPFGGVGDSGIGNYHGKSSFDTFTHYKPILHQSGKSLFDPDLRYPPYTENDKWWMNKLLG